MAGDGGGVTGFGRFLQSDVVLRLARTLYLVVACLCLAAVGIGVMIALLAQVSTFRSAHEDPVPAVHSPQDQPIDVNDVAARLSPPRNLRFISDNLTGSIAEGEPLGYFAADTPNGIAWYPNDFEIVGGRDVALFTLGPSPDARGRTGLFATAALAQTINAARAVASPPASFQYAVRAIARDSAGSNSRATDVNVVVNFGAPTAAGTSTVVVSAAPGALEDVARGVALAVDPTRTDVYFETHRAALQVPSRCRATGSDAFVAQYRRGFEAVRAQLTPNNVSLFFVGVCEAWQNAIQRGEAQTARDALAAQQVEGRNLAARLAVEGQKVIANLVRNIALSVVVLAAVVFMAIALFLAFLAIEGHSRALRDAVTVLAENTERSNR